MLTPRVDCTTVTVPNEISIFYPILLVSFVVGPVNSQMCANRFQSYKHTKIREQVTRVL